MHKTLALLAFFSLILIGCASAPPKAPDMKLSDEAYEAILNKDYQQAEALLDVALSINPQNPYVLLNLGVVYQNTGRTEKARRCMYGSSC